MLPLNIMTPLNDYVDTPTSVESSRRESVKNDSVPQTVSANLEGLPGDRRPLLGARNSSDSIEDYIRNWKKSPNEQQEGGGGGSNDDSR